MFAEAARCPACGFLRKAIADLGSSKRSDDRTPRRDPYVPALDPILSDSRAFRPTPSQKARTVDLALTILSAPISLLYDLLPDGSSSAIARKAVWFVFSIEWSVLSYVFGLSWYWCIGITVLSMACLGARQLLRASRV